MKYKRQGSIAVVAVITVVVLIGAIGAFIFFSSSQNAPITNTSIGGQLSSTSIKGDINRDGSANEEDASLIRSASPCNHADACWNKVVGKTKDGDNPIYASDLDLNKDENINEMDVSAMSVE